MNQSTNRPIDQSTNRPIDQSTNRPIDQSTNRPIDQNNKTVVVVTSTIGLQNYLWLLKAYKIKLIHVSIIIC